MMQTHFFNSQARVAALHREALAWEGTPWAANSCSPGPRGAVSCHQLPGAIYAALGAVAFEIPPGSAAHSRHSRESLIVPFLDARPEFLPVLPMVEELQPGDLVGFRIYHIVHHLGVVLQDGLFIHSISGPGTIITPLGDATWLSRLAVAWRPLDLATK